jgi:uncharacterized protein with HEPN domain
MRKDDLIRLRHMLDAAREAVEFAQDGRREDLVGDRKLTEEDLPPLVQILSSALGEE